MIAYFKKLDRAVQAFLRYLCIVLFIALALILLTNVAMRVMNDFSNWLTAKNLASAGAFVKSLVPITSMHWFDEIVELTFAALVFYGAAALWGIKGHFCVGDWISRRLPNDGLRALYKMIVSLLSASFIAVFFWYSLRLTMTTSELSTVFQIPKGVLYCCMPISSLIMLAYSLGDVALDLAAIFTGSGAGSEEQASQSM